MSRNIMIAMLFMIPVFMSTELRAEEEIELDQVPQVVLQAAYTEVPGFMITEANVEAENDMIVYELEGEANGKEYTIEISADGQILEIDEDD